MHFSACRRRRTRRRSLTAKAERSSTCDSRHSQAMATAEQYGWWGAPRDSDARLWLVHDASVIPPSGPSVSLRLFDGEPYKASKWTDDEIRARLQLQAAEANLFATEEAGRLVWVSSSTTSDTSLMGGHYTGRRVASKTKSRRIQRVAITPANGMPGPAALQPQHSSQIYDEHATPRY